MDADSLVAIDVHSHVQASLTSRHGELVLFVVAELDDDLRSRLAGALRTQLSPRHVPDTIAAVQAILRTLTGKELGAPVKRILRGAASESVVSRGALADPGAIDAFVQFSEGRAT